jgi:hypothetical protein
MRLSELNGRFVGAGGEGVYTTAPDGTLVPAPAREGVGVTFTCPCGKCDEYHDCCVLFENPIDGGPPFGGGPRWKRVGETIDTLTLTPSILRTPSKGGCGWHGLITNGEIIHA